MKKIFLLGIGSPRCGTTWLYKFLSNYKEVNFGFKKEYHVFDSVYINEFSYFSSKKLILKNPNDLTDFEKKYLIENDLLRKMESNHKNYFKYFSDILNNQETLITGDITPTYCALSTEILKLIKDQFILRGCQVKVIFMIRDPVEKIWSESKFARKFNQVKGQKLTEKTLATEIAKSCYKDNSLKKTTEYSKILVKLKSIFLDDELYLGLYENMHSENEILRLCNFLNISPSLQLINKKINSTPEIPGDCIDINLRKLIAEFYKEEYLYFQDNLPELGIKKMWLNATLIN